MLFHLNELQKETEISRELRLEREEIESRFGSTVIQKLTSQLKFRIDPMGFVVQYTVCAVALCECVRCAGSLQVGVNKSGSITLRDRQPEDGHILLSSTEMNVRFITDSSLDMKSFVKEIVELALPSYPRHEEEDPRCNLSEEGMEGEVDFSPFGQLSKYLDKPV